MGRHWFPAALIAHSGFGTLAPPDLAEFFADTNHPFELWRSRQTAHNWFRVGKMRRSGYGKLRIDREDVESSMIVDSTILQSHRRTRTSFARRRCETE